MTSNTKLLLIPMPPFCKHVGGVVLIRADEEMFGVYACRIVAAMTYQTLIVDVHAKK